MFHVGELSMSCSLWSEPDCIGGHTVWCFRALMQSEGHGVLCMHFYILNTGNDILFSTGRFCFTHRTSDLYLTSVICFNSVPSYKKGTRHKYKRDRRVHVEIGAGRSGPHDPLSRWELHDSSQYSESIWVLTTPLKLEQDVHSYNAVVMNSSSLAQCCSHKRFLSGSMLSLWTPPLWLNAVLINSSSLAQCCRYELLSGSMLFS